MSARVSIILYAHNASAFVEASAISLLAQDYPHLDFYFSDDGSSDATFAILERTARASARTVKLWRNPTNLGICNQINRGVAETIGELILLANADDIYPPNLLSRFVTAWSAHDPHPTVVWADLAEIGEDGRSRGRILVQHLAGATLGERVAKRCQAVGATELMIDRRVFDLFGPLPDNLMLEDSPLVLRALLLGEPLHIEEALVSYRVHSANISQTYLAEDYADWVKRRGQRTLWQHAEGHRAFIEMLRDLYQRPATDATDIEAARWVAIERLTASAMLRDFYAHEQALRPAARLAMLGRLAALELRLVVKRLLPFIEERNLGAEYQRYLANKASSALSADPGDVH